LLPVLCWFDCCMAVCPCHWILRMMP
jgi:hypothetical protein